MKRIFRVEALQAREGDALLVSYGEHENALNRIIVDAGHSSTGRDLVRRLDDLRVSHVEVLIVTHVDADHIEGVLDFLDAVRGRITIGDVWFNGWRHLRDEVEGFGPVQGERLTNLIASLPWNRAFEGHAVRTGSDGSPARPPVLEGGMRLTVLSPDRAKLAKMVPVWEAACMKAGLVSGATRAEEPHRAGLEPMGADIAALANTRTKEDAAIANGTSIAVLAEYAGRRALFASDAHPDILLTGLKALDSGERVSLDLFKLPHHGSQANVTTELLAAVDCRNFVFSTDGSKFNHPDQIAVARVIASRTDGTSLYFNYRQENTSVWEERSGVETRYPFRCVFPESQGISIEIDLDPG